MSEFILKVFSYFVCESYLLVFSDKFPVGAHTEVFLYLLCESYVLGFSDKFPVGAHTENVIVFFYVNLIFWGSHTSFFLTNILYLKA